MVSPEARLAVRRTGSLHLLGGARTRPAAGDGLVAARQIPLLDGAATIAVTSGSRGLVSLGNRLARFTLEDDDLRLVGSLPALPPGAQAHSIATDGVITAVLLGDGHILAHRFGDDEWRVFEVPGRARDVCVFGDLLVVLTRGSLATCGIGDLSRIEVVMKADVRARRLVASGGVLGVIGPETVQVFDCVGRTLVEAFRTGQCRIPTGLALGDDLLLVTDHELGVVSWHWPDAEAGDSKVDPGPREPRCVVPAEDTFMLLSNQGLLGWGPSGCEVVDGRRAGSISLHELGSGVLEVRGTGLSFWRQHEERTTIRVPGACHAAAVARRRAYIATETGLFAACLNRLESTEVVLPLPLPGPPHAVTAAREWIAVASPAGVALMDGLENWTAWAVETPAELVAIAMTPGGDEVACSFGAQVVRFGVRSSPHGLALLERLALPVYPWAMTYQGSCLWLACGDGGLWKLPSQAEPVPTGLVEFAVAVAASGSLIACTTSAEVVLIDGGSDASTVLARRGLRGDVSSCIFQNGCLVVATGRNLAILDPSSSQLELLTLLPLAFPPTAVYPLDGALLVVGVGGASLVVHEPRAT